MPVVATMISSPSGIRIISFHVQVFWYLYSTVDSISYKRERIFAVEVGLKPPSSFLVPVLVYS